MPPYVPPPEPLPWRLVWCPGEVRFRRVLKETQTLGRLYALYARDRLLWVAQSLNTLVRFMRRYYGVSVHCSSGYRIIRRESRSRTHNGFVVSRLADALELNELLDHLQPLWIATVIRDPDKWETEALSEAYAVEKE